MPAKQFYTESLIILAEKQRDISQKLRLFSLLRLFIFLLAIFGLYLSFGNILLFSLVFLVATTLFLFILSKYTDIKHTKEINEVKISLISNEIEALQGNFSNFASGEKYEDPKHPFASDLDIFKKNGIFAFCNRTTTDLGEKQLKNRLLYGSDNPEFVSEILLTITKHMEWTFHFRAVASLNSREKGKNRLLTGFNWNIITIQKWFALVVVLIPIISWVSLLLVNVNFITNGLFSCIIILCLLPTMMQLKNTNHLMNHISELEDRSKILKEQVKSIHSFLGSDENNIVWINSILGFDSKNMLLQMHELHKLINRMNARNNMLLGIILNVFFAWDIQLRIAFFKWKVKNSHQLTDWENGLADLEGYISAATVRFNYPTSIFAKQSDDSEIVMSGLKHPLLLHKESVTNDFKLVNKQQFMILTGPNMAGKSTYLRAVGCAIMFANAGFPVFATNYSAKKLFLYTSMRTSDDLSENSSYFFAELSRLRTLMHAVETQADVFVLLDEILKGTNSKDKAEGSYLFMKKMQKLNSKGIIATHDLSLCELEQKNNAFYNAHFDSVIVEDELSFNYQLKSGICQNMNASFLLKKMNLID